MTRASALASLGDLGFNDLEAEVYMFLLPSEPITAYRIGRAIGRPTANVYKAVESLARRGAVVIEEGEQRTCRAVPVADLTKQLERAFRESLDRAKGALTNLQAAPLDERVYKVESVPRLFERRTEMLRRARRVAIVDAFPGALERIRPAILEAARRDVDVFVEAYAPIDLPGVRLAVFPDGARSVETWGSEQLNVVVDGAEHIVALLSSDLTEIRQAVWSNSLYLSCLQHAGRLCEHTVVAMIAALADGKPDDALRLLEEHRFFLRGDVPGQRMLVERLTPKKPSTLRKKPKPHASRDSKTKERR